MSRHKTSLINIQSVGPREVDILIQPVVNWLNNFDSVLTEYSCQGNKSRNYKYDYDTGKPYVLFYCDDLDELKYIYSKGENDYRVIFNGEVDNKFGELRFVIRFTDQKTMLKFIKDNKLE